MISITIEEFHILVSIQLFNPNGEAGLLPEVLHMTLHIYADRYLVCSVAVASVFYGHKLRTFLNLRMHLYNIIL